MTLWECAWAVVVGASGAGCSGPALAVQAGWALALAVVGVLLGVMAWRTGLDE